MRTYRIGTYRELRRGGFAANTAIFYARRARESQIWHISARLQR